MKLSINGELCEARRCEVIQSDEKVSTYLLKDGTMVRVRVICTGIWRLEGKVDQNGQPLYHLNWHIVPTTEPPEEE